MTKSAVRLTNGNTLISGNQHGWVREVNPKGEIVWDVTKAMGAEIPHWVDNNGNRVGVGQGRELSANGTADWLRQHAA